MAVPRSLAPLLLLVIMSVIPAALAGKPPASDSLTKACDATGIDAETCINVLRSNPESATASPRRLAELAFQYLVKDGPLLVAESKREVAAAATKDEGTRGCVGTLADNLSAYVDPVSKLAAPEQDDSKFAEARDKLNELLRWPSSDSRYCTEAIANAEPIVLKMNKYERMLQTTLKLMEAAAPSKGNKA